MYFDDTSISTAASRGTLSGFDSLGIPQGNPSLAEAGWSISQLQAYLLNESEMNFPTNDWVRKLDTLIHSHMTDLNNPHGVTLASIGGDITKEIFGTTLVGTPPPVAPCYSFDASFTLPIGSLVRGSFGTTNLYRMQESMNLVDETSAWAITGSNYTGGAYGVPLFPAYRNCVPANWATLAGTEINTFLTAVPTNAIFGQIPFYMVTEEYITGSFGIAIPYINATIGPNTLELFIVPTTTMGELVFTLGITPDNSVVLDLATGECRTIGTGGRGYCTRYTNGVLRVSFTFRVATGATSGVVRVYHRDSAAAPLVRDAIDGRFLFKVAAPQISTTLPQSPVVINSDADAFTADFTLDLRPQGIATSLPEFILSLTLTAYKGLSPLASAYAQVMTMGALTITRDHQSLFIKNGNTTLLSVPIENGMSTVVISYNATTVKVKTTTSAIQIVTGSFAPVVTTAITFKPFGGYVNAVSLYACSEQSGVLEYLANA